MYKVLSTNIYISKQPRALSAPAVRSSKSDASFDSDVAHM